MKTLALCAFVLLAGCTASDPGLVDVASQESAVESAEIQEVPPPAEDLRSIHDTCVVGCHDQACVERCDTLWGPGFTTDAPVSEEDMRYVGHAACDWWCFQKWGDRMDRCLDQPGFACEDAAQADLDQCSQACNTIFGGGL